LVLRKWKGSHEVGNVITYQIAWGKVFCEPGHPTGSGPDLTAETEITLPDFEWFPDHPAVLFLRRTNTNESQFGPGLRITGGDGIQGMYGLPRGSAPDRSCNRGHPNSSADDIARCNTFVDKDRELVTSCCRFDPVMKELSGTPFSDFLNQIQALADAKK
jgi:hypothetical protein